MFEHRKAEHVGVQAHQAVGHPVAQREAQQVAAAHHRRHQLEVVHGDGPVRVAQRLQRGDLFALRGDQPGRHHVQQKGRHRQEDRRQHRADHLLLADLVVQHRVGDLLGAAMRRLAAVRRQLARHFLGHVARRGLRRELERGAVPGAAHVHGGGQFLLVDPEHAERTQVRHAPEAGEDVLGRQGASGDPQQALLAVHQRRDRGAIGQPVGLREPLGHHRLEFAAGAAARGRKAPGAQGHAVEAAAMAQVDADEMPDDRIRAARHGDARAGLHRGLHHDHAIDPGQPAGGGVGGALDLREDVGELAALVELVAGEGQRVHCREAADEAADAAGNHQGDRDRLAPQQPQVAPHLAVQGLHRVTMTVRPA